MSNLTAKDLFGSMTALATPMSSDGAIDYKKWHTLVNFQVKSGINAIVVAGTTGESAMLDAHEFKKLLTDAVKICHDTTTYVIAGTGQITADAVIAYNIIAYEAGAQAALVVTPYYIRTTQNGLKEHFIRIADESSIPVILYNVPSRTHNDLLPKTTAALAQHKNIIGIKEACVDENRIPELMALKIKNFAILSGNDDAFTKSMQQGAVGVISVASNVRPQTVAKICTLIALGDVISAKTLNSSLESLYKMLSYQPNPIPVKYLLNQAGLIDEGIRLPLTWFDGKLVGAQLEIEQIKLEYSKI